MEATGHRTCRTTRALNVPTLKMRAQPIQTARGDVAGRGHCARGCGTPLPLFGLSRDLRKGVDGFAVSDCLGGSAPRPRCRSGTSGCRTYVQPTVWDGLAHARGCARYRGRVKRFRAKVAATFLRPDGAARGSPSSAPGALLASHSL